MDLGISQFRPDALPVIGAQFLACDKAICCGLDGDAVGGGWPASRVTVTPCAYLGGVFDSDSSGQRRDTDGPLGGKVLCQVHAPIIVSLDTEAQVPGDKRLSDTVFGVENNAEERIQAHRHARFVALLAAYPGGMHALGKKLGYKDGAFLKHIRDKRRKVTEHTIRKIEELPGCAGWFDGSPMEVRDPLAQFAVSVVTIPLDDLDAEDKAFIEAEAARVRQEAEKRAARYRRIRDEVLASLAQTSGAKEPENPVASTHDQSNTGLSGRGLPEGPKPEDPDDTDFRTDELTNKDDPMWSPSKKRGGAS